MIKCDKPIIDSDTLRQAIDAAIEEEGGEG